MHRVFRVEHQVEDDLLQLALVAVDAGQVWVEIGFDADLRGLELMVERVTVSRRSSLRSTLVNSVPLVREKLSRPLTISEARKVCWVIFSSTGARRSSSAHVLGQHLGVAGDDGERRVDLVGDAGCEQADGGEFFGLGELRLRAGCGR